MGPSRDHHAPDGSDSTLPLDADRPELGLVVLGAGLEIEVALAERATWTLGRAADNDIVIGHPSVSRHHARLHAHGGFALEALAATNPLRLGDRRLGPGERVAVAPGEVFAVGALVGVIRPIRRTSAPPPPPAFPGAGGRPSIEVASPGAAPRSVPEPVPRPLRDALAAEERRRIVEALRRSAGNQSRAAELLGMPRRTLVKRLRDYGIPRGRVIPDVDS